MPTEILVELLEKAATEHAEENVQLQGYEIQEFFDELDKRDDINYQTLIKLEWFYVSILGSYGTPKNTKNLHIELAKNPEFFIEVFKFIHKPGGKSAEKEAEDLSGEQLQNRGMQAYRLLNAWSKIPGSDDAGNIDESLLTDWIEKVRTLASQYDRLDAADSHIGKVLAQHIENDDHWPPDAICRVIEQIDTESLKRGFSSALYNKRGTSSRGPFDGGIRERELVAYFDKLAGMHRNKFPTVATILEGLSKEYEQEAKREDEEAERNRLDY